MAGPVVATRSAGCVDAVDDGETGLLVAPRDPAALRAALLRLLGDGDLLPPARRCRPQARGRAVRPGPVVAATLDARRPRWRSAALYLSALRLARPAPQLVARALRPVHRRRFPAGRRRGPFRPLEAGRASLAVGRVWAEPARSVRARDELLRSTRTTARTSSPTPAPVTRREPALLWRAGFTGRRGPAPTPGIPTRLDPRRQLDRGAHSGPERADARWSTASRCASSLRLRANVEDDILGNHVIRNARALVLGGARLRRARLLERGLELLAPRAPGAVLAGWRPLRAQPRLPPRRAPRPARDRAACRGLARRADRAHAALRRGARTARRRPALVQRRHARARAAARPAGRRRTGWRVFPRDGLRGRARRPGLARVRLRPAGAAVPAGARARGRALVPALARRPSRSSSTRARSTYEPGAERDRFRGHPRALDRHGRRPRPVRALGRVPERAACRRWSCSRRSGQSSSRPWSLAGRAATSARSRSPDVRARPTTARRRRAGDSSRARCRSAPAPAVELAGRRRPDRGASTAGQRAAFRAQPDRRRACMRGECRFPVRLGWRDRPPGVATIAA